MGLFYKPQRKYRIVANETATLVDNEVDVSEYYVIERKYVSIFGKEKWKTIKERVYHGYSTITFKSEEEATGFIKLSLYKEGKRVVRLYETRDDKIGTLLDEDVYNA